MLLVALAILILVLFGLQTNEWYVAEATDPFGMPSVVEEWVHFGLVGQENHLTYGDDTRTINRSYKGLDQELTYPDVARNTLYLLIGVILMACWFVYLAVRYEYGLAEGDSRWSYMLPSIVGTVTVIVLGIVLLYFYVAFEGALDEDMGSAIVWDTAGVSWAFWAALVSLLLMVPAVAISFSSSWRAMDRAPPVDG